MTDNELEKIALFQGLSKKDWEVLKPLLHRRTFEKGEILLREGEGCRRLVIVLEGKIKLYRMSSTGREQILETLGPGGTCACNPGSCVWSCGMTAEAMTPCVICYLWREDYTRLVEENKKISDTLNRILAEKLRSFSSLIEEVSLKDSKKRLIKFLLDMYHEQPPSHSEKEKVIFLPLKREEIAQRIGTVRETVVRQFQQLKRAHLIDLKPYQVIIRDLDGLQKLLQANGEDDKKSSGIPPHDTFLTDCQQK